MIRIVQGNLLTANCQALVNTVNTVGVMGKGIALQFKRAWPDYFRAYQAACASGDLMLGKVWVYRINGLGGLAGPEYIISFPTKGHWRERSRIECIDAGLVDLIRQVDQLGIQSIALPPLGCGYGGLSWPLVRGRIESALHGQDDLDVHLYEPGFAPAHPDRTAAPVTPRS
jgi:O-acetyl-ADP-ribose deacetylase (regulator of RNase III)